MILDLLGNLGKYKSVMPFSDKILAYLDNNDIAALPVGKYQIAGDSVFILIQEYSTKPESDKKWETHKKYIDIQIVLDGEEYIAYAPSKWLNVQDPYKEEKDVIIYQNDSEKRSMDLLAKNTFAVYYPDDAHKPGILVNHESAVKKAVIKVKVQ